MCGISCIISNNPSQLDNIEEMNNLVAHRGPDCDGIVRFNNIVLGHRRLSIIDLSYRGHQPMSIEKIHLVFNGEIYNFRELRTFLEKEGYFFRSDTDTEVVLNMYRKFGTDCVNYFEGMFAAIIFDDYSGKIFAFRDNFGIKPLYLWRSPAGDVALGSEIKQFTVLDGWEAIVNEHLAYDFLVNGWLDHTDGTMFKGVTQLRGGHYIYCNLDEMVEYEKHVVKFSDNREKCDLTGYDAEVLSGELYNHLNNAVISHLHADVPVGSCLSGGLDSSSIVALVERNIARGQVQKTFSAVSEHKIADESEYIDAFVSSLDKVHPYSIYPNVKDLFEELDDLVWHMDEPFGSTSIFAQRCVFKKARDEGIKVMLDGQGSDELFGGYDAFVVIRINELLKSKQYLRAIYEGLCTIKNKGVGPVKSLVWGRFFGRNYPVAEWLSIEDRYAHYTCAYSSVMGHSHDLLYSVCLPALLHYEDRNSSCFSIEARVPFLDRNLSNFAQGIPSELKVHNGWTKYILRDAMTGTLINKLRLRKDKMGFATPEEIWIRDNRDMFKSLFVDAINRSEGIIKHEAVRKFDRILDKREPFSFWIWRIIVLGAWMRVFDVHREN